LCVHNAAKRQHQQRNPQRRMLEKMLVVHCNTS
jgi:hypothetical protein